MSSFGYRTLTVALFTLICCPGVNEFQRQRVPASKAGHPDTATHFGGCGQVLHH
ncbi:intercellular adhesion molecule 2 [Homo sapiens]|uniref:Intercellular adhesion molecule 2 n=1 Tax=Homo sapiens TaxID=9606 RepID=J3KSR9_HUMAN|nr:intercellular adhesion molecule 2 [Homo sapiens]KAI4051103.1 intercellular adhesion molecule 2 [Homo sapiens]